MIIDAHTHIFPDPQAEVFLKNTSEMFNVKTYGLATESDLISKMDESETISLARFCSGLAVIIRTVGG